MIGVASVGVLESLRRGGEIFRAGATVNLVEVILLSFCIRGYLAGDRVLDFPGLEFLGNRLYGFLFFSFLFFFLVVFAFSFPSYGFCSEVRKLYF